MSKHELEKLISENLKPGSNQKEIENFLEQEEWIYDFDAHNGRYQARNPDEDKLAKAKGRHQIYVYVNEKREFTKVEVDAIFNGL